MAFDVYPSVDGVTNAFPPVVRAAIAQAAEVTGMVDNKIASQFNNGVKPRLENLEDSTLAINAPLNFDANSVAEQAVHNISSADNALNMPGPGSWNLFTWPLSSTLQQMAILYSVSAPEIHIRVNSTGGWSDWNRTDAGSMPSDLAALKVRVTATESKNAIQDNRLSDLEDEDETQNAKISDLVSENEAQDARLDELEIYKPIDSPDGEYAHMVLDSADRMIEAEKWDGTKFIPVLESDHVITPAGVMTEESVDGYVRAVVDGNSKLILGERPDGTIHIPSLEVDSLNESVASTKKKIVVVAGQSNALWKFNTDGPGLSEENPRLTWWNRISLTEAVVSPNVTPSIASEFSRKYLELNPDVSILIVPVTVGSTGFKTSSIVPPPEGYLASPGGTWDRTLVSDPNNLAQRLFDSLSSALIKFEGAEVLAMLWSQGENDRTRMTENTYAVALDDLLAQIRLLVGNDAMPVILGSMTPEEIINPQFTGTDGILRALEQTQSRLYNTAYVWGPENYLKYQEQIHWSPEGNRVRGIEMATDGLRRARSNVSGSEPHSPINLKCEVEDSLATITWDYPVGRTTSFLLETSIDGVVWAAETLDGPLVTKYERVNSPGLKVRVSSLNEIGTSYPTIPIELGGTYEESLDIIGLVKSEVATADSAVGNVFGPFVELAIDDLAITSTSSSLVLGPLPEQMRPSVAKYFTLPSAIQGSSENRSVVVSTAGNISIYNTVLGDTFRSVLVYSTQ